MIIHNFNPIFIDFGLFQLRWYSLAYILGIVIGWMCATYIIKATSKNNNFESIKKLDFDDLIIYIVIGIVLGGRFGYVIFYNLFYYSENILEIFKVWQGGMSFHGGLLGVIIAVAVYSNNTKINFFKYTDIISCVAPIGIFFGRIANFINGELYGKVANLPWSVVFPDGSNLPRHPSQIYEAVLEGVVLFILINYFAIKKKIIFKPGYVSGLFLIFYSIFRIISETFREPDIHIGIILDYFSLGTLLSIVTIFFGILIIFKIKKNEQNI
jgi:phosphatidylglycerol---prolipoprotein diacylglyceryl transferase